MLQKIVLIPLELKPLIILLNYLHIVRAVGRFQILGGQREKRSFMRPEHTLGFLVSDFGRNGYFKYCK